MSEPIDKYVAMTPFAKITPFTKKLIEQATVHPSGAAPRDTPYETIDESRAWARDFMVRVFTWGLDTRGDGPNTERICNHIRKELKEIEAKPKDLEEWIDILFLGLDGAFRCKGGYGEYHTPDEIMDMLEYKLDKNQRRKWIIPTDPTQPIEHDRTEGT